MENIRVSASFRKMALKAIAAIIYFISIYFSLLILAAIFTLLCGYGGIMIILIRPMLLTIAVGAGIISLGFFIMFFLVKFMFRKHKVDLTHLVEVTAEQEPELFSMIGDIVREVQTDFPRKVYFSSGVNAAVFYNSSFWSMILPVKKNLEIGIGLMNGVSAEELKAILAHEFGHFSQRSMKIGSYVYNVNKVIHDMLYDNESFGSAIGRWANVNGYIRFFMLIAVRIIYGIQWVLQKTYNVVNKNYMGLSRQMEFHADEVAANVAGSAPLITSLQRLNLADYALNIAIAHYNSKIVTSVRTENIYQQQRFVMQFEAQKSKLPLVNGIPILSSSFLNRFNKSRLVIEDQWSSHPSTKDRVAALELLNIASPHADQRVALKILRKTDHWQEVLTEKMFSGVVYENPPVNERPEDFESEYSKVQNKHVYPELYKGYYDFRNPTRIDIDNMILSDSLSPISSFAELYSDNTMDMVYTKASMESDIVNLRQIGHASI